MQFTFNILKEEIKTHPDVVKSFLFYTETWKTAHYNELSNIINENLQKSEFLKGERKFELGNTISAITLKRFLEGSISDTATNDLRFIKTLDKICIFLGYASFNEFISKHKNEKTLANKEEVSSFEHMILETSKYEFEFLKLLPKINLDPIKPFVHENSPYYNRISSYLQRLNDQKFHLNGRPSSYEVYNLRLKSEDENLKVITTNEFWNLNFLDPEKNPHHYHILNEQNYFIKKIDDTWRIWDNYNPNVWELTDKI